MSANTQKLTTDLRVLVTDAEELVKATAVQAGDKIAEIRGRIQQTASDTKPRLAQAEAVLEQKVATAAADADTYVRTSPWTAVGIAAGVGFLLGILAARR